MLQCVTLSHSIMSQVFSTLSCLQTGRCMPLQREIANKALAVRRS